MPDRDAPPDPIDTAYVQAEALLGDDAAHAARRARVLAAVARETMTPPAASSPPWPRSARRPGGWLAAASVVGLSVFLATRLYSPAPRPPPAPPPAAATLPAPQAPQAIATPPPAAPAPPQASAPRAVSTAPPKAAPAPAPSPPETAPNVPPPPPMNIAPVEKPRPSAPAPAPPPVVATAERNAPAAAANEAGSLAGRARDEAVQSLAPMAAMRASPARPPADDAARLRAAAAAGRTAEVEALLAQGVPVDAADPDGETALMKSVQADHPAAAAVLRRHGASLDRKNHGGASARDMAKAKGDAELNGAIGVVR